MRFKRAMSMSLAVALAIGAVSTSVAFAKTALEDYQVRAAVVARMDAHDEALKAMTDEDREETAVRLESAFDELDMTGLTFQERAAVLDADMFSAYLAKLGFEKDAIKELEELRAGAIGKMSPVPIAASMSFSDWVEGSGFDDVLYSLEFLTDEQRDALLEESSRVVWHDTGMSDGYLRQLKISEENRETLKKALMDAYKGVKYDKATEQSGYGAENYVFDAFVEMLQAGDLDVFIKARDEKTGELKLTGEQKLALSEIVMAAQPETEFDLYTGLATKFAD